MFFKNKKSLPALQAAQCAGLTQALDLIRRIRVPSSKAERDALSCGENFRLLEFYGVNLTQITSFNLIDGCKAIGEFRFWTPRYLIEVTVSLEQETRTLVSESIDGFHEEEQIKRWKPVQCSVWAFFRSSHGDGSGFSRIGKGATRIRGTDLVSTDDLELTQNNYEGEY